jgi:LysM repeat protein
MFFKNRLSLRIFLGFLVVIIGLSSCVNAQPSPTQVHSPPVLLTPYISPTPSQEPDVNTPVVVTPTELPTPTPTPLTYTIEEGDTMLAIALRNGINLEELQAANPEVNPRLLSVGTVLIIPLGDSVPSSPITATPIPLNPTSTDCYAVPDGIWCTLLVTNERSKPLENISARVILYDEGGEIFAEGIAIAAINRLPVNEETPLVIFFPGSNTGEFIATTTILTAQPVPKNDDRYLNAWLEIDEVVISAEALQAEVSGSIGIPAKSSPGNLTWVVVTAYDSEGRVVGVRKLEQYGLFEPGASREFMIEVFSLGPPIAEVKALVEVRP